jgi:transcriptional regulator with XRE-family HTH domain
MESIMQNPDAPASIDATSTVAGAESPRPLGTIPEFVRAARKVLDATQLKLAERLGVSQGLVSQWEQGQSMPTFEAMSRLSEVSGVPLPVVAAIDSGFGSEVMNIVRRELVEAQKRLPAALLKAQFAPLDNLKDVAEFLLMLDDLLSRYPAAD